MGIKHESLSMLQARFDNADHVWFFVKTNYRIIHFNKKAAINSIAFHNKQISPGDSILDYARDTMNNVDQKFITCFGKSAAGHIITRPKVIYESNIVKQKTLCKI